MIDATRARPVSTVLDTLRARIDPDAFDVVVFALESVVADLGYGDVRALVGSIAWVDKLRADGKRTALVFSGESAGGALHIAGVGNRFDAVAAGSGALERVLGELGVEAGRSIAVDTSPEGIRAARDAGVLMAIGVVRGTATPEQLRRAGCSAVVADLQELL